MSVFEFLEGGVDIASHRRSTGCRTIDAMEATDPDRHGRSPLHKPLGDEGCIVTLFGEVEVGDVVIVPRRREASFPLDEELNLKDSYYSHAPQPPFTDSEPLRKAA